MMTACAGRLTPQASVTVHTSTLMMTVCHQSIHEDRVSWPSYLDDDSVCGQVDAPGERGGAHEHLDEAAGEVLLHQVAVGAQHAGVVDAEAVGEQLSHLAVTRPRHLRGQAKRAHENSRAYKNPGFTKTRLHQNLGLQKLGFAKTRLRKKLGLQKLGFTKIRLQKNRQNKAVKTMAVLTIPTCIGKQAERQADR